MKRFYDVFHKTSSLHKIKKMKYFIKVKFKEFQYYLKKLEFEILFYALQFESQIDHYNSFKFC
jgi:hypothetical protein